MVLTSIVIAAFFMILEVFVLKKWIRERDERHNSIAWTPFRKMMLDAVVKHADDLIIIATEFESETGKILDSIREKGQLDDDLKDAVIRKIDSTSSKLDRSRNKFFNILQTVAPSLQPYAAEYCGEVLWFADSMEKQLGKARGFITSIPEEMVSDNNATSHELNGVWVMVETIKMFRDFRFKNFKKNFTQSVWKKESLHYYEPDGEFLPPEDYAMALDTEKKGAELKKIPRTTPIKSFFDKE